MNENERILTKSVEIECVGAGSGSNLISSINIKKTNLGLDLDDVVLRSINVRSKVFFFKQDKKKNNLSVAQVMAEQN